MVKQDDVGFDESEELNADDLVVLEQADGTRLELVLLAVVELKGATYAVLTPRDEDEDSELMVTTYAEDDDGTAHFAPIEDDSVFEALQEVVQSLLPHQEA